MEANCSICLAQTGSRALLPENTLIQDYGDFSLYPTIGPIADGHAMIISKEHYASLSSMPKEKVHDIFRVLENMKQEYGFFSNVLVFEHGSFNDQSGGACTVHTHIHLLPEFGDSYNILDDVLPQIECKLEDICNIESPYIMTIKPGEGYRLYEAYNVHSQMMRKAICKLYGRQDSDWKTAGNTESILKTIQIWK